MLKADFSWLIEMFSDAHQDVKVLKMIENGLRACLPSRPARANKTLRYSHLRLLVSLLVTQAPFVSYGAAINVYSSDDHNVNANLHRFEQHLLRPGKQAAAILGVPYSSYLQYRSGAMKLPEQIKNHIDVVMRLPREELHQLIRDRFGGSRGA